jgi:hypothetical protein
MSAVTKFFFTPAPETRGSWAVINWWESRRAAYNIAVGSAGTLSLAMANLIALLPPRAAHLGVPWGAVLAYGILANVCYTFGPAADAYIRNRWGERFAVVGPVLFRYGFVFSIGLSLLPIPVAALGWIFRLLGAN